MTKKLIEVKNLKTYFYTEAGTVKAVNNVQKETGVEIRTGLDVAASEFYRNGKYVYKEQTLTPEEQVDFMLSLIEEYDLHSVEDPLDQNDFELPISFRCQTKIPMWP